MRAVRRRRFERDLMKRSWAINCDEIHVTLGMTAGASSLSAGDGASISTFAHHPLTYVAFVFGTLKLRLHDTTGCQAHCQTGCQNNRLYRVYKHSTGCRTRLTTGLTNGYIVYTAGCQTGGTTRFDNQNTVIKPVVKPV